MKTPVISFKASRAVPAMMAAAALILAANQWLIFGLTSKGGVGALGIDEMSMLAPALLANGESPVIPGYQTRVKKFPTISPRRMGAMTGDQTKDAMAALIPHGMPFYGQAAGVSFDDPLKALKRWGEIERATELTGADLDRFKKIAGVFTCDFCCGSPQNPTRISNCGCAHAGAWRGMARWFIKNYGSKYDDAQIMGEMSRWKALWYPGPVVKRVLDEMSRSKAS